MIQTLALTVLLLPGALGSDQLLEPLAQALRQLSPQRVILKYQPRPELGKTPFADYEQQLRAELRKHPRVLLVGHSMGGLLAGRVPSPANDL